ncbi:uncharacterized protein L969DRAFT_73900 [Mixia osmundae IAM 14324]|uniref:Sugar phosphate transporter domain-containing protein n=1 Tax=Mixia osmundae (strain CBS 9802 / IAM 14324 / JCM 22182 / KY 12970) TaxID=764103 RepID=G7DVF2_MIXOS|nr:uncharacterized protein L969DRAFT_73900 [Mixia osmundae IAM 14324]KEI40340.1 hypothetical protein L969DRAFT_73900 [Mixia osmundae IAM 14324]GAA94562.1 hypothetical protein E5Q_01214 [Mixia osmundae IAM 14324]
MQASGAVASAQAHHDSLSTRPPTSPRNASSSELGSPADDNASTKALLLTANPSTNGHYAPPMAAMGSQDHFHLTGEPTDRARAGSIYLPLNNSPGHSPEINSQSGSPSAQSDPQNLSHSNGHAGLAKTYAGEQRLAIDMSALNEPKSPSAINPAYSIPASYDPAVSSIAYPSVFTPSAVNATGQARGAVAAAGDYLSAGDGPITIDTSDGQLDSGLLPHAKRDLSLTHHASSDSLSKRLPQPKESHRPVSPALGQDRSSMQSAASRYYQPGSSPARSTAFALSPSQSNPALSLSTAARRKHPLDNAVGWIVMYFAFNLGLTLYNKFVLVKFPFPWTLTGVHALCGAIGAQIAQSQGYFVQSKLSSRENSVLVAFSVLYTVNIAVSNLSLHLVTVPFHQVVRAMTPLFTVILSATLLRKRFPIRTYVSLIPVVAGVGFATYGDYSFTAWGFILTLLGTVLAAMKTIVTNLILVGRLKLHPLDLLLRMSPLAFVQCVFFSYWTGELARVREYGATQMDTGRAVALLINGVIAFGLNVVSFTANKKTSALTMTVAANVKQVLTIVLAVQLFNLVITPANMFGICLTLFGGAWYARVEMLDSQARKKPAVATPLHDERS